MRPIILHVDYNNKKQIDYINIKNTRITKHVINIRNENTNKLKYNENIHPHPTKEKNNHLNNNSKEINNKNNNFSETNKINNIDDFVEMIKKKTLFITIPLIKNHHLTILI